MIGAVCKKLFKKSVATQVECVEEAAEALGVCEAVLLGPEDPLADACAAIMATVVEASCYLAIKEGGKFAAKDCQKAAGCKGSELEVATLPKSEISEDSSVIV